MSLEFTWCLGLSLSLHGELKCLGLSPELKCAQMCHGYHSELWSLETLKRGGFLFIVAFPFPFVSLHGSVLTWSVLHGAKSLRLSWEGPSHSQSLFPSFYILHERECAVSLLSLEAGMKGLCYGT